MKKILLTFGLLFTLTVQAEDFLLPEGCYVSYSDISTCYSIPNGNYLVWNLNYDQNTLARAYGPALAIILSRYAEVAAERDDALNQWDLWSQKSAKQAKQIKRLKAQLAAK